MRGFKPGMLQKKPPTEHVLVVHTRDRKLKLAFDDENSRITWERALLQGMLYGDEDLIDIHLPIQVRLILHIKRGTNLISRDMLSGRSDPYIIVSILTPPDNMARNMLITRMKERRRITSAHRIASMRSAASAASAASRGSGGSGGSATGDEDDDGHAGALALVAPQRTLSASPEDSGIWERRVLFRTDVQPNTLDPEWDLKRPITLGMHDVRGNTTQVACSFCFVGSSC